jgi:hypothetical protein
MNVSNKLECLPLTGFSRLVYGLCLEYKPLLSTLENFFPSLAVWQNKLEYFPWKNVQTSLMLERLEEPAQVEHRA